jgi:hypothetical protein
MRPLPFFLVLAYGGFIGWSVRKLEIDRKLGRAITRGTTEFIAYAKAVPPAEPNGIVMRGPGK